jgi:hypothetical protein
VVTFTACPFTADYPEQREGPPTSKVKIDNVNLRRSASANTPGAV